MNRPTDFVESEELSLAQLADETTIFQRSTALRPISKIVLGKALLEHPSGNAFTPVPVSGTIRNFQLRNVVLDADSLVLLKDGKPIPETAYFVPPELYQSVRLNPERLVYLDDTESVIIGFNRVYNHYQHWITQCLPAIDSSLRDKEQHNKVRLVLPPLKPWQEDMLAILGYSTIARLTPEPGRQYFIPHAEYSEFLNGSSAFNVCPILFRMSSRLLKAVLVSLSPYRVIYVPCSNPYYGVIDNEQEVIDLLVRHGVHILDRQRLSDSGRFALFHGADVVIGAHGEGLSDVLFCRPGSLLWEWMPRHHQNACFNRLAQAGQLEYWGDLFETVEQGKWRVDIELVGRRLSEVWQRVAFTSGVQQKCHAISQLQEFGPEKSRPSDKVMASFENLGDNCEFGLVQRLAGCEPLGLLRFAGIFLPIEVRLSKLVRALELRFEGLGAPEKLQIVATGAQREFIVTESEYNLMYHTFKREGEIDPEKLRESEAKRLGYLRRKLLDDLETGEKAWVWKSLATVAQAQIMPLLRVLRHYGPNNLLWVVERDEQHSSGTVERLDHDLLKGYVERFAPYERADDISPLPWFEVCRKAYDAFGKNRL